ncbi:30S ribosomal protein S16 [Candidatus Saccharibacteria bacterium]|nr:30S ribosomal protein S16 [Candidatus Saccharibacteria bacterium]
MLRIKLQRTGKKHRPSYRIVVGERANVNEVLGSFNPAAAPPHLQVDKKKVDYWVDRGAKVSESVEKLLKGKYEYKPYVPKKAETSEPRSETSPQESTSAQPTEETQTEASDTEKTATG